MKPPREHWEEVYGRKRPGEVSWYRPHLERSLRFIDEAGLGPDAGIIDVGGGASTLVDDLLTRGFTSLTVLDVSAKAIDAAKARLGEDAGRVRWLVADITGVELPPAAYDFWHDRAVFHFLTDETHRQRYVKQVRASVRLGGHVLVATFAPDGPAKCSGLDVARYGPLELHGQFGSDFQLVESVREEHHTPAGVVQPFTYCLCRIKADAAAG